jgi:hypothetical protein
MQFSGWRTISTRYDKQHHLHKYKSNIQMHAYLAPNLHSLAKGGSSSWQYHELLRTPSVYSQHDQCTQFTQYTVAITNYR